MNPKMDSGYIDPGEDAARALEDEYDTAQELSPAEVLGIMDQLLCHEVGARMPYSEMF